MPAAKDREKPMAEDELAQELEELIRQAQEKPGIIELMTVYGRSAEVLRICNEYLEGYKPKNIVMSSANSA